MELSLKTNKKQLNQELVNFLMFIVTQIVLGGTQNNHYCLLKSANPDSGESAQISPNLFYYQVLYKILAVYFKAVSNQCHQFHMVCVQKVFSIGVYIHKIPR